MLKVSEKATRFNSERSFQRYRARVRKVQKLQPSFCLESHVSSVTPNVRSTLVALRKGASHPKKCPRTPTQNKKTGWYLKNGNRPRS